MIKKSVCLSLALLVYIFSHSYAQPHIQRSTPFEITDEQSFMKVIQYKSGKTGFLSFTGEGGIAYKLYDTARRQVLSTKIRSTKWDADDYTNTAIRAVYEINGELVIFLLQQNDKKEVVLHRIRVNEETGKISKEDEVASAHKVMLLAFALHTRWFLVQKDPASDCYGIISIEASFTKFKCKVQHFDGNHNLLSSSALNADEDSDLCPIAMAVNADKSIFIAAATRGHLEEMDNVYVARLDKGATTASYKELEFTKDFRKTTCQMQYRPADNKLQVLLTTLVASKRFSDRSTYASVLAQLDPATLGVSSVQELSNQKINEFAHTNLATENEFSGVCNGFVMNSKNETFLLNQEMSYEITPKAPGSGITKTYLGNIGITQLGARNEEMAGYLVERKLAVEGEVPFMFLADNGKGVWVTSPHRLRDASGNQETKFLLASGKTSNYVLINEPDVFMRDANAEKIKRREIAGATTQACYYTLRNGAMSKALLFDKVTPGVDHTCYVGAADVGSDGTVATVELNTDGSKSTGHVVWISFE